MHSDVSWNGARSRPSRFYSFRNAIKEVWKYRRVGKFVERFFIVLAETVRSWTSIASLGSFMIGVNGVVTFKNSGLSEVLKDCSRSEWW